MCRRVFALLIVAAPFFMAPALVRAQGACEGCNPCSPCDQMTTTGYPEYFPLTCGECGPCEQCCVPNYQHSDSLIGRYVRGAYELWEKRAVYERQWVDNACGQPPYSECLDVQEGWCYENFFECCESWGCWGRAC